jgi:hypothetical protein
MTKACMLALFTLLTGCDELDNCPEGQPAREIVDGRTDLEALVYESAPWGGKTGPWEGTKPRALDAFPPGTELHFIHHLGVVPYSIDTYLAFSSTGTNGAQGGDVTENAGNQGRVQCVDAERIIIMNDTCEEDFYIRVVASGSGSKSTETFCAGVE